MAIHGEHPGISVSVRIKNRPAKEYETDNDPSMHVDPEVQVHEERCTKTVFIESKKDKAYTIKIEVGKPFFMTSPTVCFRVSIDGQEISKPLMRRKDYTTSRWSLEIDGPVPKSSVFGPDSTPTTRALIFSEIARSELPFSYLDARDVSDLQ